MPVTISATEPGGRLASYVDRIVRGEKLPTYQCDAGSREVWARRQFQGRQGAQPRSPAGLAVVITKVVEEVRHGPLLVRV